MTTTTDTMTIGDFLKEKLGNMARWVTEEVGKENLPVDVVQLIKDRTAVEVTVLAEAINAHSAKVTHRVCVDCFRKDCHLNRCPNLN